MKISDNFESILALSHHEGVHTLHCCTTITYFGIQISHFFLIKIKYFGI